MINLRFFQFYLFIINYFLISLQFHFCDAFVSCKAFRIDSWFAWFLPLSRGICLDSSQIVEHWPLRLACIPQWAPNNSEYFIRGLAWSFACIFRLEGEPAEERNLFFFFYHIVSTNKSDFNWWRLFSFLHRYILSLSSPETLLSFRSTIPYAGLLAWFTDEKASELNGRSRS